MKDVHRLDVPDAAAFSRNLEEHYGVLIWWRLEYQEERQKSKFVIHTVAGIIDENDMIKPLAMRSRVYPSVLHKTLGGAIFGCLSDLEDAIHAQRALMEMAGGWDKL